MDDRGLNDAAILLMSLGEEEAAEVFKHLSPKEVQKLGETIARMRGVTKEKVDFVVARFTDDCASQSLLVEDASDYVKSVLRRALGDDKASLLLDRILQGGDVSGIESLKWMDPVSVAELLRNEHPQIVAAILVHLEYEQSAAVLMQLPERMRSEVMLRVATLEGIQPSALKDWNEVLYQVLAGGDKIRKTSLGGVKTAAEMMNLLGGNADVAVLDTIRNYDADLAQKIMDKMFVFDDLVKLDGPSLQLVLREVASETLIVALKGGSMEVRDKILANMSKRAAEALRGARIFVSRSIFPKTDDGEYYWIDLIGLNVVNRDGAALGTVAVIVRQEIVLAIMGGIFVVEAVSVMLQVVYFKYTRKRYGEGRRLFRMAPLHHHFEKTGWRETQVVVRFWIITMLLCMVGLSTLKLR